MLYSALTSSNQPYEKLLKIGLPHRSPVWLEATYIQREPAKRMLYYV